MGRRGRIRSAPTPSDATCSSASSTAPGSRCSRRGRELAPPCRRRRRRARRRLLRRVVDTLLARTMDVILSFPFLLFAIALVSIVGPSLAVSIAVIAFFSWASVGRIVRGQTFSLQGARVHRGRAVAGRERSAHHVRGHPPEPGRPGARLPDAADPVVDRVRGHALVPRARRGAADGDAGGTCSPSRSASTKSPGGSCSSPARRCCHDARVQPARRQRARRLRPARRAPLQERRCCAS